jgi:tetratricopeptide (TPR) repeat protein
MLARVSRKLLAPQVPFAETLEAASVGSLVYVDERGQVRSHRLYRKRVGLRLAGALAAMTGYTGILWMMGGPAGLVVGGLLTLLITRNLPAAGALRRGTVLVAAGRLDEAETLLRRLIGGGFTAAGIKAYAEQALARVAALRGRHDEALGLQSSALNRLSRSRRLRARRRIIEYDRVVTLVNLDRVADARQRWDALPRALEGDYLRLQRTVTELYLALGEGQHRFEPAFLREQADIASSVPMSASLPALLAWAQTFAGHPQKAALLLATARERAGGATIRKLYPRLGAWMDTH